ncbi:MAG: hypothetical protein ACREHE_07180 [Rhizomicrobium sp.]
MSNSGDPPSGKPPPSLDDSIVSQARASLGDFFKSTITALGEDMQTRLTQNQKQQTKVAGAVNDFTLQMIKLLAARVSTILPQGTAAPQAPPDPPADPPAGGTAAGSDPSKPQAPASDKGGTGS